MPGIIPCPAIVLQCWPRQEEIETAAGLNFSVVSSLLKSQLRMIRHYYSAPALGLLEYSSLRHRVHSIIRVIEVLM